MPAIVYNLIVTIRRFPVPFRSFRGVRAFDKLRRGNRNGGKFNFLA